VNDLTIGLLGALLATNQPLAVSNLIQQHTGMTVAMVNPSDPVEQELQTLMADDDKALDEVDGWIKTNSVLVAAGGGESKEALTRRIHARLDTVRTHYDEFLRRHPDSSRGFLAYGTFLNDIGEEELGRVQFENAARIDPKNPAAWNNLANYYGENGPLTNAFVDYARAIELDPTEAVYYRNFATTVYLFRKDAREFYGIDEQQVFDKSLDLYRKAIQLAPDDFELATDYAQSYYGIRPLRTNDALLAWTNALKVAHNEIEREGVYVHLARVKVAALRFDEARAQLDDVTNPFYADLKNRLERNLVGREKAATNPVVALPTNQLPEISTKIPITATNGFTPTKVRPMFTNQIPALTNPPVFSPKMAAAMTNVPPNPQKPFDLQMAPPALHPPPPDPDED
jgi:tetratricopeptide (TPR) repeat protein